MIARVAALLALGLFAQGAVAEQAPSGCTEHFLGRELPAIVDPARGDQVQMVCFAEFAVLHSGVTKTPLWSAEHLTTERVDAAGSAGPRPRNFHAESALPRQGRAKVSDYKSASGEFDIGHMAPSGDMSTAESRWESFSLANTVPQQACNNEELWEGLERAVREFAQEQDEIFLVTGPVYPADLNGVDRIGDGVAVPKQIFKAIYLPEADEGAAYIAANEDTHQMRVITLDSLRSLIGIDVFPKMSDAARAKALVLPPPRPPRFRCRLRY
jgi:endonuclease G